MENQDFSLEFKQEITDLLLDIINKNKKEMICINVVKTKPNLFQSKFGGLPYIPKDKEAPTNKDGLGLALLAQINIEELPDNNIYPMKKGLLQFFILNNESYGLFDDKDLGNYKVIYYENIDKSVTEDEVEAKYNPYFEEDDFFPVIKEVAISFHIEESTFKDGNDDFEELADKALALFEEQNKDRYKEDIEKAKQNYVRKKEFPNDPLCYFDISDICEEGGDLEVLFDEYHQIGGHPCFTQNDVRAEFAPDLTLLLQIKSDYDDDFEIIWGDSGIANFFIRNEDLKALNFDNVFYNWDCC